MQRICDPCMEALQLSCQLAGAVAFLQDIFNLLPNMNVEALSTSLAVKANDMMASIYLASLIRSVLALHKLIDNKEQRMWAVRGNVHLWSALLPCLKSLLVSV